MDGTLLRIGARTKSARSALAAALPAMSGSFALTGRSGSPVSTPEATRILHGKLICKGIWTAMA